MPVLSALSNERDAFWDLLAERAALTPDRTMLVDERGRALTYGEFVELAEHVAAGMADMGVHPGQIVSWQLPTVIESALLMAALSRLKVSSNPILPILRRTEVSMIVQDLDSDWLIVPDVWRGFDYAAMAREITEGLPTQMVIVDTNGHGPGSYALALGDPATLRAWTSPGGDHPVRWYYYTSGTTGRPKGIVHTERSVMAAASYQQNVLDIDRDDVHSMPYPITHMGGPLTLTSLARVGAKTLLIETWDPLRSPLIQAEHGVTLLGSAVPFFLAYL
ncbi:MAG: AMP-binding protein, partial [Acidimicrobiia bacterium]